MNKQQEALKLALEALRDYRRSDDDRVSVAMGILQEALAEQTAQQQEPVAWKDLFWKLALILKCLPSTFPEANGHVLSKAQRLMDAEFTSPPTVQPRQRSKPLSNLTEDNIPAFPWVSQKPVAWMHTNAIGHVYFRKNPQDKTLNPVPLYTSPQPAQQQEPAFWTRKQWGMDREFCEKPFTTDWEPLYTSPQPAQQQEQQALEEQLGDALNSLVFYRRRVEALQQWQSKMRDPERTIVCDIIANGCALEPAGDRYKLVEQQEPVAFIRSDRHGDVALEWDKDEDLEGGFYSYEPLYTSPPAQGDKK